MAKIEGLEALVNLEELYVSHNGIKKMEGLDALVNLVTLDVSNNFIKRIENVSHLTKLEEFWVRQWYSHYYCWLATADDIITGLHTRVWRDADFPMAPPSPMHATLH